MDLNDQLSVIRKIKLGDRNILALIYKAYREDFIFWLIKNYRCDMEEAKDLFQYAILVFYKNAVDSKLDQMGSSIKTYLFAIGKNQAYKKSKQKSRFSYNIIDNVMDEGEDLKRDKINYELHLECVHQAMIELGDPCKKILELTYFQKLSMNEVSNQLGYKNADTTKNLKYKCVQRLKKIVNQKTVSI